MVDLRNAAEAQNQATRSDKILSAQYYNIPFIEGMEPGGLSNTDQDPVDRYMTTYLWVLRNAGEQIARALTTLAGGGNLPAVVHCSAGKDRTGILSALVLGILGVDEKDIIEDYSITNQVIGQIIQRLSLVPGNQHLQSRPPSYFEAQPRVMERVFAEIRSDYGDAVGYARAQGVSQGGIDQLQGDLLGCQFFWLGLTDKVDPH